MAAATYVSPSRLRHPTDLAHDAPPRVISLYQLVLRTMTIVLQDDDEHFGPKIIRNATVT
jgi:hypothetical protein